MINAPLIALLTDFGSEDPFSGIMKGVMAKIAPGIPLIDITHEIPPGDILRAAITLWQSRSYFPDGTVFLCVVDPGVGTHRRAIVVQSGENSFIGPDNGIFSFILDNGAQAWELQNPEYALPEPTYTFHGRDIFAPAAAYVARGIAFSSLGPLIQDLTLLPLPYLQSPDSQTLEGEILYADHFGNMLTSLGCFSQFNKETTKFSPWFNDYTKYLKPLIFEFRQIRIHLPDGNILPLVKTFSEAPAGGCAGIIGSSGLLEIIANQNRATDMLNLNAGDHITFSTRRQNTNG